jgi:hypothetical protein
VVGGYYRAVDQFLGTTETNASTYPRLLVDPYLGLRLVALSGSLDFDVTLGPVVLEDLNLSDSGVLVKPLLGTRAGVELSGRWALGLAGRYLWAGDWGRRKFCLECCSRWASRGY